MDEEDKRDPISKFLGMSSIDEVIQNKNEIVEYKSEIQTPPPDPRREEDFEESRDMMKKVLEIGGPALEAMADIAEQSQNPQAYEKLGALINSMAAASKNLMDLHKTKKSIDKVEQDNPGLKEGGDKKEIHNHLYVGSTSDLQAFIALQQQKKEGEG